MKFIKNNLFPLLKSIKCKSLRRKINFLKILTSSFLRLNKSYGQPIFILIEPNDICNLRCPTCVTGSGTLNRLKGQMSFYIFRRIIDQLYQYLEVVDLTGYGEPFMNNELLQMVAYAKNKNNGIYIIVATNGHFLKTDETCKRIVESGLDEIVVSLDGASEDTLKYFRGGIADFQAVVNGFKLLVKQKRKLNRKFPKVTLQFIVNKLNYTEIPRIKEISKMLGIDELALKSVGLNLENSLMLEKYIPDDTRYSRYYRDERGVIHMKGAFINKCKNLYYSTMFLWNGDVVPCCYDMQGEFAMGNILEDDFKTIWNSAKYKDFRILVRTNRKHVHICRNWCPEGRIQSVYLNKFKVIEQCAKTAEEAKKSGVCSMNYAHPSGNYKT